MRDLLDDKKENDQVSDITVYLRDGTQKRFEDRGAPGGSYHASIRYEWQFAIHKDAYGKETVWPMDLIARIEKEGERRW